MGAARCKSWPTGSGGKAPKDRWPKTDGPQNRWPAGHHTRPAIVVTGHGTLKAKRADTRTTCPTDLAFQPERQRQALHRHNIQHSHIPPPDPLTHKNRTSWQNGLSVSGLISGATEQPCDHPARRTGDIQVGLVGRDRLAPTPAEPRPANPSFGGEPEAGFAGGRRRTETALRPARHSHTATRYLGNHAPTFHSTHSYVHQSGQPGGAFKIFIAFSETWRNTPIAKTAVKATIAKVAK